MTMTKQDEIDVVWTTYNAAIQTLVAARETAIRPHLDTYYAAIRSHVDAYETACPPLRDARDARLAEIVKEESNDSG
jgi:hypothetical protein